uniref:Cathepsin B-like proteinase n=1 Tax=Diabrotica virgifera virgifera TaxID=50390 RepID=Q70EW7_DIAVI|nr:cathepsin B-like proteinase [Diabrotica virgifera virgifera]
MKAAFIITLLLPIVLSYKGSPNPLSNDFINYINSKQSTWVAGKNFDENLSIQEIKNLLGAKKGKLGVAKEFTHSEDIQVPNSFDARENWKECSDVISTVVDQSDCGSCWAVAAASAMSDRRCIASQGKLKVPVSAENLLSCCDSCGYGCEGGYPTMAWSYWIDTGITTGGLYGSKQGCQPYSLQPCEHHTEGNKVQCSTLDYDTPSCKHKCDDSALNYKSELTFGSGSVRNFYSVANIQKEILTNGPVEAAFDVYSDFVNYKSGVYQHVAGEYLGGHAVRILGWGEESGVPYWLVANSWNEDWGDKGLFKIRRGNNESGFEDSIVAAPAQV